MSRISSVLKPLLVVTALAGFLSACHGHHGGYRDGGYYGPRANSSGYYDGYRRGPQRGYWR
ncbi:hypothetical protein EDC65_1042 [Stella humosa]|uniref:Lipoprotein n=2 Tax=Stella humosa TaxID=94 RepID=A0A3N1MFE1_9PROT|nr:hypothetical protein EDC65_1042 [Stella humosa]